MNLPAIIPTNHHQKLPPKMVEPATATSANTAILYLVFIAVVFLKFMRIQEVRELSFNYFICLSVIRLFFYASFCRVGRFRFRGDNGVGFRTNKVYEKNTLRTKYGRKIFIRIACGSTLFVRKEPVNTFAHVTKMIDAIECIISQMEVNE